MSNTTLVIRALTSVAQLICYACLPFLAIVRMCPCMMTDSYLILSPLLRVAIRLASGAFIQLHNQLTF